MGVVYVEVGMRKNKPRNLRSAARRNWTIVDIEHRDDVSYLGLQIWTDRHVKGRYISSFYPWPCKFAFELEQDASMFALKWL